LAKFRERGSAAPAIGPGEERSVTPYELLAMGLAAAAR
jgi:uncharacterized OsmC-like protein